MISAHAQLLISKLLDDEISEQESRELMDIMAGNPEVYTEAQGHLLIWELWSRHCHSERSDRAFLDSCLTRLRVEIGNDSFVEETRERCLELEADSHLTRQLTQEITEGNLDNKRDMGTSKYPDLSPEEIEMIASRELNRFLEQEDARETFPRQQRGTGFDWSEMKDRVLLGFQDMDQPRN